MEKQKLFNRDFTMVVIGQIISLFGNAVLRFALPLHLLRETGSSALFGMVTACSFIPMVFCSLFGGVIADRVNKRNIMVVLDFGTAALIVVFYAMLGRLPLVPLMIVVLMILYGISGTYQPSVQASIPVLVDAGVLMQGNAVINIVNTLSGLLGPVIGGVLYGSFGIYPVLLVSIVCFTLSAVMEIFIHIPYKKRSAAGGIATIVKSDLTESWQFVKNEKPSFISVVCIIALFNLVLSAAMIVGIPVIVVNILGMSDQSLGITQGALGLGGLAGGMLAGPAASKLSLKNGYFLLIGCSAAALFIGISLLPQVPGICAYVVITVASFAAMACSTLFVIQMFTVVQQQTPPHLLGKIMAAITAVSGCSQPVGQAVYGVLFEVFDTVPSVVMAGSAALAFLISLYSKRAFLRLAQEI